MKQYLLSVYHPEGSIPEPEVMEKIMADVDALNSELQQAGAWVFAGRLYPPSTATVVPGDGGDGLITGGPLGEGQDHVGGFWGIKAPAQDSAVGWGRQGPPA